MAYNRENLLRKIIEVQEIVLEHKKKYTPQIRIYELYIKEKFHISYSTFNEYIGIPAKAQLKELLAKKEQEQLKKENQLKLFDEEEA